jgi:hypothetical protein
MTDCFDVYRCRVSIGVDSQLLLRPSEYAIGATLSSALYLNTYTDCRYFVSVDF